MSISLKQLRGFVAVADAGSFAEACEYLHLSQPALSVAIRKLEGSLGGPLFARTTRSVTLTPEGLAFLPVAQRLLADWQEAIDDQSALFALQRGKLNIAAMPSFASNCLPKVLQQFCRQFTNINISVQDIVMEEVISAVQTGRVDLGITFQPDHMEAVDFQPLFTDSFIAILPPEHPLVYRQGLVFADLLGDSLVTLNRGSNTRQWTDEAIQQVAKMPAQIYEAYQLTTVGAMVAAGVGVAVVPALCASQMEKLGAVCRPFDRPVIQRCVGIFTRRRHPLSSVARQMINLLQVAF